VRPRSTSPWGRLSTPRPDIEPVNASPLKPLLGGNSDGDGIGLASVPTIGAPGYRQAGYGYVMAETDATAQPAEIAADPSVSAVPWSRSLQLSWKPCPRVFDHRSDVVDALAELEHVDRFHMEDGGVTVILERGHEVRIGVHGLGISILAHRCTSGQDLDLISNIVSRTRDLLRYEANEARFFFQHLLAWDASNSPLSEVFASATRRVLSETADQLNLSDFALLSDGVSPGGREFQFECGVIDADSAAMRLSRILGRTSGVKTTQIDELFELDYPAIASFVDTSWRVQGVPDRADDLMSWINVEMTQTEAESIELAEKLHAKMIGTEGHQ